MKRGHDARPRTLGDVDLWRRLFPDGRPPCGRARVRPRVGAGAQLHRPACEPPLAGCALLFDRMATPTKIS